MRQHSLSNWAYNVPSAKLQRSTFHGSQLSRPVSQPKRIQERLVIQNFKFMKKLGLKKPEFLPDFGVDKRKTLLESFYTKFDSSSLGEVLADDLKLTNAGKNVQTKADYIFLLTHIKGSMPDFQWKADTTAAKDKEGFAEVRIKPEGTFNGTTFAPPRTPPVEPSGNNVALAGQTTKILVEDGQIKHIEFTSDSGPLLDQLYAAVGGKIPLTRA